MEALCDCDMAVLDGQRLSIAAVVESVVESLTVRVSPGPRVIGADIL